jgi:hypothetical protein
MSHQDCHILSLSLSHPGFFLSGSCDTKATLVDPVTCWRCKQNCSADFYMSGSCNGSTYSDVVQCIPVLFSQITPLTDKCTLYSVSVVKQTTSFSFLHWSRLSWVHDRIHTRIQIMAVVTCTAHAMHGNWCTVHDFCSWPRLRSMCLGDQRYTETLVFLSQLPSSSWHLLRIYMYVYVCMYVYICVYIYIPPSQSSETYAYTSSMYSREQCKTCEAKYRQRCDGRGVSDNVICSLVRCTESYMNTFKCSPVKLHKGMHAVACKHVFIYYTCICRHKHVCILAYHLKAALWQNMMFVCFFVCFVCMSVCRHI